MIAAANSAANSAALGDLDRIVPFDALEAAQIDRARRWMLSGARLARRVKPACPPQHLVAYFPVVDLVARAILLGDHRGADLWLPPGGHVEPAESPRAAVLRECQEELGLPADPPDPEPLFLTISRTLGAGGHVDVSIWYPLTARAPVIPGFDRGEYRAMGWFAFDQLPPPGRTDPNLARFVAKLRARGA